jgi:hypothetical protein
MIALFTFEGPLSELGAVRLDARETHHRSALGARRPFGPDRSGRGEREPEHFSISPAA